MSYVVRVDGCCDVCNYNTIEATLYPGEDVDKALQLLGWHMELNSLMCPRCFKDFTNIEED